MSAYSERAPRSRGSFNTSNFSAVAFVFVAIVLAVLIGWIVFANTSNDHPQTIQEQKIEDAHELEKQESEQEFLVDVLDKCKMFKGDEKKMDCIEKFVDPQ